MRLSVTGLPAAIRLAASGSVDGFFATVDPGFGGVLTARPGAVVISAGRGDHIAVAAIGVLPTAALIGRCAFQRAARSVAVAVVHLTADIAADEAAEQGAGNGRRCLTATASDLAAEYTPGDRADDLALSFLGGLTTTQNQGGCRE